jgi:hypothetical protein
MSEVVERVRLFYREGRSDKVYRIELIAEEEGLFHVVGYNGRRGARLVAQPKTQVPVPYSTARRIFDNLEQAKLNHRKTPYRVEGRETFKERRAASDAQDRPAHPAPESDAQPADSYRAAHLDALEL